MRRHTTIDLDMELVRRAGEALGTSRITETVHAALDEVVRRRIRMGLSDLDPAIDLADLESMRGHRFAERPASYDGDLPPEPD